MNSKNTIVKFYYQAREKVKKSIENPVEIQQTNKQTNWINAEDIRPNLQQ